MKKALIIGLTTLSLFGTVLAEDEEVPINESEETKEVVEELKKAENANTTIEASCISSFRVYNNTSQTVTIHNAQDIDVIVSGSYSYTYGECGTPVQYSVEGEYKLNDGSSATCSYKADGTRNYPEKDGTVESIGLTALCGNEEKSAEIKSFTETQYKYSGWSNSGNPKEYVYGLKIKATSPEGVLAGAEFTLSDKDGNVMQDMSGNDAIITTDENGEATIYLFAGYNYFVKETKTNEKWSIHNGEIVVNNTNATVVKTSEFALNKFEEYYSITFENQLSDSERELQENLASKQEELSKWKETTLANIEKTYNGVDKSNFNENAIKESLVLKQQAIDELNAYVEKIDAELEDDLRNEKEVNFVFDLGGFEKSLNALSGHWLHWALLVIFILGFVLHFIYNKHLIIDLLIIPGVVLYLKDICTLSKVFIVGLGITCVLFTLLEIILSKKTKDFSEN